MCRECLPEPVNMEPIFFTTCAYCEELSDHVEISTSEGACLQCVNCDTVILPEQTHTTLLNITQNREKIYS